MSKYNTSNAAAQPSTQTPNTVTVKNPVVMSPPPTTVNVLMVKPFIPSLGILVVSVSFPAGIYTGPFFLLDFSYRNTSL